MKTQSASSAVYYWFPQPVWAGVVCSSLLTPYGFLSSIVSTEPETDSSKYRRCTCGQVRARVCGNPPKAMPVNVSEPAGSTGNNPTLQLALASCASSLLTVGPLSPVRKQSGGLKGKQHKNMRLLLLLVFQGRRTFYQTNKNSMNFFGTGENGREREMLRYIL